MYDLCNGPTPTGQSKSEQADYIFKRGQLSRDWMPCQFPRVSTSTIALCASHSPPTRANLRAVIDWSDAWMHRGEPLVKVAEGDDTCSDLYLSGWLPTWGNGKLA